MPTRRQQAFTLIEMMVSVAVLGVVTLYLTDMLIRQNRAYTVVDQVTEAQQNLRAIGDLMEREMRVTGFMVAEAGAFCGIDNTNGPDVVFFTDSDAINPVSQSLADVGVSVTGGIGGTLNLVGTNPTILDGVPFYDNSNDGVADDDFLWNPALGQRGGVIVYDRNNPAAGVTCGILTAPGVGANSVSVDWNVTVNGVQLAPAPDFIALGPGSDLAVVPAHWYAVVPTPDGSSQLLRDGAMLADDVEDLQFAAFYDLNDDDVLNAGEYFGGAGSQYVSDGGGNTALLGGDNTLLRELRVNFVVRTRDQDVEVRTLGGGQGTVQTVENHAPPVVGDGFRRRIHTVTVRPRNVGIRPPGV